MQFFGAQTLGAGATEDEETSLEQISRQKNSDLYLNPQGTYFGAETQTATTHSPFESRKQTCFQGDIPRIVCAGIKTEKRSKARKSVFSSVYRGCTHFRNRPENVLYGLFLARFSALITKMKSIFSKLNHF